MTSCLPASTICSSSASRPCWRPNWLLSIQPTRRILAWQKAAQADAGFMPALQEVGRLRRVLLLEIHLFALIPILAAAMARGIGLG